MALSRDALHRLLWNASGGPHHTVCIVQARLCEDLLCSPPTLNRALRSMVKEGRLDQLTTAGPDPGPRTYVVADPDEWARLHVDPR